MNTETYSFEDNVYIDPTVSRDQQLSFVDSLRDIQAQKNQEIEEQTHALGTDVPANLGGLTSGATRPDSYFMSRYQTPQVNAQVAALRTAAQQSALNTALANLKNQWSARYNEAYRNMRKRASSGSSTGGSGSQKPLTTGNVTEEAIESIGTPTGSVTAAGNTFSYFDGTDLVIYELDENGNIIPGSERREKPTGENNPNSSKLGGGAG